MLVLALLTLAALVLLSMTVVFVPQVRAWDEGINVALGPYRTPTVLAISLWITALGAGATRIAVMTVAAALLWADGRTRAILPFWVCYLTAETVAWGAKYIIDRHRPEFLTVASAASPSFPSAHAAGSAAVYGLVALLVLRGFRPGLARPVVTAVATIVTLLVALSRVALGVHYTTDVIGGLLVGALAILLGACLIRS